MTYETAHDHFPLEQLWSVSAYARVGTLNYAIIMHKDTIDSNVSNSLTCESLSEDVQCGLQQILFVNFHTYTCTVQTYKFCDHRAVLINYKTLILAR